MNILNYQKSVFFRTILIAILMLFIDVFFFSSYIMAGFLGFVIMTMLFKLIFVSSDCNSIKPRLIKCGVYLVTIILIFIGNSLNSKIAQSRAEMLIMACEHYKIKHGDYPPRLTDMVPEIISKIPKVKYALYGNEFRYESGKVHHVLGYTIVPPFYRRYFYFETKKWKYLD